MLKITLKEFKQLSDFIHENYGIHLKEEKQTLVLGRLQNVLQQAGFTNFTDYFNYLVNDKSGVAAVTLVDKITTNHTFFMREADHFYFFRDKVLPQLINTVKNKDLRIWCAACSSGEESYTLAMILDEFFGREKALWDTKVLATDISDKVLTTARAGIYGNDHIEQLPEKWKRNYFNKYDSENSIITEAIRNEVIYRKLNLMEPAFPFKKKFHVIFCRNVMIYFDLNTKIKLANKLYDLLDIGGYLFIGHSESLGRDNTSFKYIMPSVYRKE